jgi:hypothetical protein
VKSSPESGGQASNWLHSVLETPPLHIFNMSVAGSFVAYLGYGGAVHSLLHRPVAMACSQAAAATTYKVVILVGLQWEGRETRNRHIPRHMREGDKLKLAVVAVRGDR